MTRLITINTFFGLTLHLDKGHKVLGISIEDKRIEQYGIPVEKLYSEGNCSKKIEECVLEHILPNSNVLLSCTFEGSKMVTKDIELTESASKQIEAYIEALSKEKDSRKDRSFLCVNFVSHFGVSKGDEPSCTICMFRSDCGAQYSEF